MRLQYELESLHKQKLFIKRNYFNLNMNCERNFDQEAWMGRHDSY